MIFVSFLGCNPPQQVEGQGGLLQRGTWGGQPENNRRYGALPSERLGREEEGLAGAVQGPDHPGIRGKKSHIIVSIKVV